MNLRLADMNDLPQLKVVYKGIINQMNKDNIRIWDDIYPYEFLGDDIENKRLYVMMDKSEIVSAFALCDFNAGENLVKWKREGSRVLYIERLGVNVNYLRKGVGSEMIHRAVGLAKEKGAEYLRLFVVDINTPAVKLYEKCGFEKVSGSYDEIIDRNFMLREFGYEMHT